jgi:hypothetical protein
VLFELGFLSFTRGQKNPIKNRWPKSSQKKQKGKAKKKAKR